MFRMKFGTINPFCRACIIDGCGVPPMVGRSRVAEMFVICQHYPCADLEDRFEDTKGC